MSTVSNQNQAIASPDPIILVEANGRVVSMNAAARHVLRVSENASLDKRSLAEWMNEDASHVAAHLRACVEQGVLQTGALHLQRDGRTMEAECVPLPRQKDSRNTSLILLRLHASGNNRPSTSSHQSTLRSAHSESRSRRDVRALEALAENQEWLKFTLDSAGVGTWDLNIATGELRCSENLDAIHGRKPGTINGTFKSFLNEIYPEDRQPLIDAVQHAIAEQGAYEIEYRAERADGSLRWITGRGRVQYVDGKPIRMLGVCFDVTRRKRAERDVHQHREWLQTTLKSIGDAVIATDATGRISFMNPVAESLTGWRAVDAVGQQSGEVFRIFDPQSRRPVESPVSRVLRDGRMIDLVDPMLLVARDGREWLVDDSGAPIRDSDDRLIGAVLVFRNITERMQSEQALRDTAERMRAIFEAAVDGIITITEDGIIESFNPAAEKLFGYQRDEIAGKNISVLMPSPYRDEHDGYLVNYRETGIRRIIGIGRQVVGLRKDGSTFPMELAVSETRLGDRRMFTGIVRDVTERMRAEQALRESENRFRSMADATSVLIWVADTDKRFTYFNKGWLAFTGRTMEQERDRVWGEGVHPDDLQRSVTLYDQAFARRESFELEYRRQSGTGEFRWLLLHAVPRFAPDGVFLGYIGTCIDITDRKRFEEQLQAVNESLEQRVRERTREAEQRALQLRALAFDLTQAEQRERRRLAQTLHDHLQQILVAAMMRMGALLSRESRRDDVQELRRIKDLLSQSIEASRTLTVELSPPVLYDAGLFPALHWLARRMHEKHVVDIELDIRTKTEPVLEDVRVILFESVRELVFNAVKHAGVNRVNVCATADDDGFVRVTVADDGVGFDTRILNDDRRASESFGLFHIRERLDVLGGKLEIDSQPQRGTRVTLVAPIEPASVHGVARAASTAQRRRSILTAAETPRPAKNNSTIRVLLADDHKILREGLRGLLLPLADIEVVGEASDGHMAVRMARQLRPDVVVMDVTMPRMNGIEATRIIKREFPQIRVVALSMHEPQDMAASMREAGATTYLAKDGPSDVLIDAIRGRS